MNQPVGIKSLAISIPEHIRTNDYWYDKYPEIVAEAEKRIWFWKKPKDSGPTSSSPTYRCPRSTVWMPCGN